MLALVTALAGVVVTPKAPIVVVGNGGIQILAARLAAIRGYETTLACAPQFIEQVKGFLYDDTYTADNLPLTILPIAGDEADADVIAAAAEVHRNHSIPSAPRQTPAHTAERLHAPLIALRTRALLLREPLSWISRSGSAHCPPAAAAHRPPRASSSASTRRRSSCRRRHSMSS